MTIVHIVKVLVNSIHTFHCPICGTFTIQVDKIGKTCIIQSRVQSHGMLITYPAFYVYESVSEVHLRIHE